MRKAVSAEDAVSQMGGYGDVRTRELMMAVRTATGA